ncbi:MULTISPECIES: SSI family serine proteinase inhibitor [unclassified Saccharopolyspora]|uniref:SSI family serine proteinase inhibitor n=1 Tax=unclassified Saccharopolyspora TaxID=2646250 RepID=UPI001CD622C6|nr:MULTISPECIES: SSI family serine proteinase inhibitor [unclassified Saccharopolyspora]MCA1188474.1 subtilase-type protease inhibitor [Saccharopolyspora sp. 6T]MCA1190798.1 subtilase-type protease inhibitor [Saccharopolyspora sp. 6V]MCA1226950.1 subtilase-type protease inhibitor [Saccharopolyspora sp. 6M]MCA1282147.1 subtilase-type protease inhibitor [Saccharopolyspora sp. 7B]
MAATRFIRGLLLAATAVLVLTPATAGAAATQSDLTLTIAAKDRAELPRTVSLRCEPVGGSHPNAAAACDSLTTAGGDFEQLGQAHTGQCTMELKPVVGTAHGTWQGRPVHFEKEFGNQCVAASAAGAVFDF